MPTHLFKLRIRSLAGLLLVLLLESCGGSPVPNAEEETGVEMAIHYVKASNTDADDWFGTRTALSADGNTMAIAAIHEGSSASGINGDQTNNASFRAGAVYVFVRSGDGWVQQAYVKSSYTDPEEVFGWSVALSADGNTLAVAAYREASTDINDPGNNASFSVGAVHVFTRSGSTWTQQAYLKASNPGQGDHFGWSLALSADGHTLAVGAPHENSNTVGVPTSPPNELATESGAVYVFTRDAAGTWAQQAFVKASNAYHFQFFGHSVALSGDGNTLAVGAFGDSSASASNPADRSAVNAGAAYVLTRDAAGIWTHQDYLKASNIGAGDLFGLSIALSGDGNTLAVSAPGEDGPGDAATNSGAVYVFTRSAGTWTQQAYLRASNADPMDGLGDSLALTTDGSILAIGVASESSGAKGFNGNAMDNSVAQSGAVYVMTRSGDAWTQQAYVKANTTQVELTFGASVALSGDGLTWAVGAVGESSNAKGINGNQADTSAPEAGAVYLMDLNPAGSDGSCTPHTFAACKPPSGWR